jgi:hypothetical protein
MPLVPRVITYRPQGQVIAVSESAVVDTGTRKVVYVERMPGMFDGVEIAVGARCGEYYPVIRGLEPGQRVATSGAFLIDAETRLNPGLAAAYFGSGARPSTTTPTTRQPTAGAEANASDDPFAGLSPSDRALVVSQKICPVTKKPLGSMGPPVRATVGGKTVFLCCEGCEPALKRTAKASGTKER